MSTPLMSMLQYLKDGINWSDPLVWIAVAHVTFNPMFWNISARMEYKKKWLSKIFGSAEAGCHALAATVFLIGLSRNIVVILAVIRQLSIESYVGPEIIPYIKISGVLIIISGLTLAISSMVRLGVTGTYLGDYFGMLKDSRVTAFPYNVVDNPMYFGSTLAFLGLAVRMMSPIGLILTIYIHLVYSVALHFEEPFTAKIYNSKDSQQSKEIKAQ